MRGVDGEVRVLLCVIYTQDWCVVHLLYHHLLHTVQCRGVPAHPTG